MADAVFIRNTTLIDGTDAEPLEGANIAIEDGRISATGRDATAPAGAEVVDGDGLWAVPGLIDTHVHLELVGHEALPVFLALGLTTIRDLGGPIDALSEARRSLNDGTTGPRLLFTGPMIDGVPPTWPALVRPTANAGEAAEAAQEYLDAGVDAIKLYTTLPLDSVRRCIEQVDGRVPVTGHLGQTLASEAMEAGIDGVEHVLLTAYNDVCPEEMRTEPGEVMMTPGFWQKLSEGWLKADLDSERAQRLIRLVVERDVSFCPTLTVLPSVPDEPDEEEMKLLPQVAERWQQTKAEREAAGRTLAQLPPEAIERGKRLREKLHDLVGRVHEAGGRIVSGTDTGSIRSLVPGFALHKELKYLTESGLSNADVLRSATARAAEALGRDDLGTIEADKRADVLLLRSDPLKDVTALRDIHRVVLGGRVFDPTELLAEVREAASSEAT